MQIHRVKKKQVEKRISLNSFFFINCSMNLFSRINPSLAIKKQTWLGMHAHQSIHKRNKEKIDMQKG